jgi:collagen type VII alpha
VKSNTCLLCLFSLALSSLFSFAQSPTSRVIPEDAITTLANGSTQTVTAQLWTAPTGGTLVFSEVESNLKVGSGGSISFLFGSHTTNGLPTTDFASGTSLYLAIVHNGVSVSKGGRIPMYATSFSLSPGPQGPMGPMGVQGLTGATGTTGVQGPQGISGTTGAIGPQGPKGDTGASGATGGTGATGTAGAAGPQGPAGANGTGFNFRNAFDPTATYAINDVVTYSGSTYLANVANGPNTLTPDANTSAWVVVAQQGATGSAGSQGLTGAMGPQGSQGLQGLTGAIGPQGAQGLKGDTGAQGLTGAQGVAGQAGAAGAAGTGFNFRNAFDPTAVYAVNDVVAYNGSTYVANTVNGPNTHTPDTNPSAWAVMAAAGAAGAVGAAGAIGPQGPIGIGLPGATGATGAQGAQGIPGTNGADGAQGPQGLSGAQGTQGIQGTNGTGFNPRGSWKSATSYAINDVVSINGSSYVATAANVSQEPDLGTTLNWTINWPSGNFLLTFQTPLIASPKWNFFEYNNISALLNGSPTTIVNPCGCALELLEPSLNSPTSFSVSLNGGNTGTNTGTSATFNGPAIVSNTGSVPLGTTALTEYYGGTPASVNVQSSGLNPNWQLVAQAGTNGTNGANGTNGLQGPQGFPGATGATGVQGVPGINGLQGPAGLVGATGAQGLVGATGATGATGAQGIPGTNGTNGTGFNPRGSWNSATSYAANDVVSFTGITYNVNLTFGSAGSVVGTITTDGTIGVLNISNMVSWKLTVTDHGTNSTILTQANSAFSSGTFNTGGLPNQDFSATSTALLFNYGAGDAGSWSVAGASGQLCFTSYSNCFGPVSFGTWNINGDGQSTYSGVSGSQAVGSGGAVGGTSTYVATAPVAAGTALGMLPWTMMAQAGTPGTRGSQGIQGIEGLTGMTGLTGATGFTGATGPTGATGVAGPAGPVHGYTGTPMGAFPFPLSSGNNNFITSLTTSQNGTLSPGIYMITASTTVSNSSSVYSGEMAQCFIAMSGGTTNWWTSPASSATVPMAFGTPNTDGSWTPPNTPGYANITTIAVVTVSQGAQVMLDCGASGGGLAAVNTSLQAVPVTALN